MVWCELHPQASTESLKAHSLLPPSLTLKDCEFYSHSVFISYDSHNIQRLFAKTSLIVMETQYFLWGRNYILKCHIAELRTPKDETAARFNELILRLFVNATWSPEFMYIASNWMGRLLSWPILMYCYSICLERLRDSVINLKLRSLPPIFSPPHHSRSLCTLRLG
jgi:hypothetical protein